MEGLARCAEREVACASAREEDLSQLDNLRVYYSSLKE
jgi:hypothetical protein